MMGITLQRQLLDPGPGNLTNIPGTVAQSGTGTAWSNLGNLTATLPASVASASVSGGSSTQVIYASNLGFSVPAGAMITGIQVNFAGSGQAFRLSGLLHCSVTPDGSFTSYESFPPGNGVGGYNAGTFGGTSDLWSFAYTSAIVNSSAFGVKLFCSNGSSSNELFTLNNVSITIYYTVVDYSDYLDVTEFTFAVPADQSVTGVQVALKGYSDSSQIVSLQLLASGVSLDPPKTASSLSERQHDIRRCYGCMAGRPLSRNCEWNHLRSAHHRRWARERFPRLHYGDIVSDSGERQFQLHPHVSCRHRYRLQSGSR